MALLQLPGMTSVRIRSEFEEIVILDDFNADLIDKGDPIS